MGLDEIQNATRGQTSSELHRIWTGQQMHRVGGNCCERECHPGHRGLIGTDEPAASKRDPVWPRVRGDSVDSFYRLFELGARGAGNLSWIVGRKCGEASQGVPEQSCPFKFLTAPPRDPIGDARRQQPIAKVSGGDQVVMGSGPVRPDGVHQTHRHRLAR
jgi:hypothetical protein